MKNLKKAVVIDANPEKSGLDVAWKLGAWRSKGWKGFDKVVDAITWPQAMKDLGPVPYDEIQFYGHAFPGSFCIGEDKKLTDEDLLSLARHVHKGSLVWLRGCAAFHGEAGHALAKRMVEILDCRVAAHTYIIGPFHSGGRSLRPGAEPAWSVKEGVSDKVRKSGWKIKSSGPFEPNTMTCLATSFPESW
jgi:hypothetical protein